MLKQGVYSAWEILYKEEKEKNPFPAKELGEDFKRSSRTASPRRNSPRPYRELYQRFIKKYLPKLQKLIDVRRPKERRKRGAASMPAVATRLGMAGDGRTSAGAAAGERRQRASGSASSTGTRAITTGWSSTSNGGETPSTLAVVLAQEDLWVYEALLRVIKDANEGATSQANAAVKRIIALDIGRDAAAAWKEAEAPVFTGKQGAAGAGGGPGSAASAGGGPHGPATGMGRRRQGHSADAQLVDYRYVDDKGQPLPASSPSILTSNILTPSSR